MTRDKLTISWDDLQSEKVNSKLQQLEAISAAKEHYEKASEPVPGSNIQSRASIWYNTVFYMAVFGALGGLLGWGFGEIMHFRPNSRMEARELIDAHRAIMSLAADGNLNASEQRSLKQLERAGRDNPYFSIYLDKGLSEHEREQKVASFSQRDDWKDFLANVLFFGVSGMMIAVCLGIAEPVVDRNVSGAVINGSVAAVLGLAGGVAVSLFVDRLQKFIAGGVSDASMMRTMIANVITWGVLGMFLAAAPGVLMRNRKKLLIGMAGGLIGGLIGGLLFDPVAKYVDNAHVSRLIAIIAIGVIAGLGTGLIENAVKNGWFKVTQGLIAGKQFVLYRNPTFIGSSPLCHIYLFKDPVVGRRHAAVHIIPGGFELEDLPLGGKTLVNGRPITRTRLRNGDRVQIGSTAFTFQEKPKAV
jgi:hypothetical protein